MSRAGAGSTALLAAVALAACTSVSPTPSSSTGPSATASSGQSGPAEPSTASAPAASATVEAAWQRLPDAPFARLEMGVAAHDGRIWMAGGLSPFGEALTDVEIYDPASGEWTDGPALPASVHHAALVSDGDRLLLIGGYLGSALQQAHRHRPRP